MDMEQPNWTLEDLQTRVAKALDALGIAQANGQVALVPNGRAIRYYQTLGLLSRPEQDGRHALYGAAHLQQLVAIKRLQARGLTLQQVQAQLLSMTPSQVETLAALPADVMNAPPAPAAPAAAPSRSARSFWADSPDEADTAAAAPARHALESRPGEASPSISTPPSPVVAVPLHGIQLGDGVTLTFPATRPVDEQDLAALRSAVGPLLDTLRARGLIRN